MADLAEKIKKARGESPADLVIKNVSVFNLTDGSTTTGDIAIVGDTIVGVGESYEGAQVIDGTGLTAVPGFVDAHVHIESSMVSPYEFERCVLPHGVTTAMCDPHEICNVCGVQALNYFIECAKNMCMNLRVQISSCVPATDMETAGAAIGASELKQYSDPLEGRWLAEMMNVPGLLGCAPDVLAKVEAFNGRIDGHAPLLGGRDLNAYLTAGVHNDHECSVLDEAREKLRKGMQILIREGSVARNLDTLMPLITVANAPFLSFCTDDRNPLDIALNGHIDGMIARALAAGCDPLAVYRTACYSPAIHANMTRNGLVAPGKRADVVLLSDFMKCKVAQVICGGRIVNDSLFASRAPAPSVDFCRNSVHCNKVSAMDFAVNSDTTEVNVIGIRELSLTTDALKEPMSAGEKQADVARDIAKVAVLERHGKNGNRAVGFVKGFGIKHGALASTVGHDSHNICVVGVSDEDMACAVNALIDMQGGFVAVVDGKVVGQIALPLAGLMSDCNYDKVHQQLAGVQSAAARTGCPLETPFLQLAFLPLPVIPFLRITDRGVFDVANWKCIN